MSTRPGSGIAKPGTGQWFAIRYPDDSLSDLIYRSPYRAAEECLKQKDSNWWPDLAERGFRIVVVIESPQ